VDSDDVCDTADSQCRQLLRLVWVELWAVLQVPLFSVISDVNVTTEALMWSRQCIDLSAWCADTVVSYIGVIIRVNCKI